MFAKGSSGGNLAGTWTRESGLTADDFWGPARGGRPGRPAADGLLPAPIDTSLANFGKAPTQQCWFVQLKGTTFVSRNGGKPICGNTIM